MKIYLKLVLLIMLLIALTLAILFPYFPMVGSIIYGLLFLLLVYLVLKRELQITLPFSINCLLFLGIFADSIGNALDFYGKKWGPLWYDSWMHLFIPFCLSFSFFWLFDFLKSQKKLNVGQPLIWIFVFSLIFSLAAFYEVTELWDEVYFGGKRIWGVHDTAKDLQWDMAGIISGMLIYWVMPKPGQKLKTKNNMQKINIFINDQKFEAELNETETAQRIYETLPIETEGDFWGNEIYFEIPVKMENENPTEELKIGDLAYWPSGNGFCIFYGKTPASIDDKPKPASPVTIIGKIKGDLERLKNLTQVRIRIERRS